jgi:hypothetical protein
MNKRDQIRIVSSNKVGHFRAVDFGLGLRSYRTLLPFLPQPERHLLSADPRWRSG